ncbi:hypothetical protein OVA24_02510 [Luteolibacter sp. SL250]|uniref:hypothetical protein n=1 Tax=Luteolibacter sp. SL250 TaxID=2995170 RepID=UPI00226DF117|nr:hypothetical protein [Luteolibacter sp. SL250]WAC20252.1 hypothetical protein OVA24_02510 [Luteolibacter sp. SL250]
MTQENPDHPEPARESLRSRLGGGSLITSIAIHGALLAVGVVWILQVIPEQETRADVRFGNPGGPPAGEKTAARKQREALARPDLSRVAAVGAATSFTLPEPETMAGLSALGSISFASGGGIEPGGNLSGTLGGDGGMQVAGGGAGPVIFTIDNLRPASRIAYVLDFSVTMAGEKDALMRSELTKALKALPTTTRYSVICFSGPVWLPGDEVSGGTVTSRGKTYQWDSKSMWEWTHRGPMMDVPWLDAKPSEVKRTLSLVDDVKTIGGTDWEGPLEMAIAMNPPPDVVFFMTDGVMEQRDMMRLTRGIAAKAKARKVTINTVAMMEPGAEEPMADLAKRTGGSFTIVGKDGKIRKAGR